MIAASRFPSPDRHRHWALAAFGAIVLVAAVLRLYQLGDNPPGLFCDEASIQYDAYLVLHTGADRWGVHLPFYFKSFGDYESPLFIYVSMPIVALLGLNPIADRLEAALFGIGAVALLYPLAMELFRRRDAALLSTAVLAISSWHILYSHVAFEAISMPFFYVLAPYLFLTALRRRHTLLYYGSFVAWGLSLYTYHVPRLETPVFLGCMLLIYYRDLLRWKRPTLIGIVIFVVLSIPLGISILTGDATARFALIGVFSQGLHGWALVSALYNNYIQHYSIWFLFIFGSTPGDPVLRGYIMGMGALYWTQFPFLLVGMAGLLARRDRTALFVLACLFLVYPIGGTLTSGGAEVRDMFGVVPFSLITGYGLALSWRWLRTVAPRPRWQPYVTAGGLGVGVALLAISLTQLWSLFYVNYERTSAGYWGWQGGPAEIIAYFKKVEPRYDDLLMTGLFNEPEIFFPIYAQTGCERCGVGGLAQYNPARRQLFAMRPEEMVAGWRYTIRHTIRFGDGTVGYQIVEAKPISAAVASHDRLSLTVRLN